MKTLMLFFLSLIFFIDNIAGQTTVTLYPLVSMYYTGYVTNTVGVKSKNDDIVKVGKEGVLQTHRGWFMFNLQSSGIPTNAIIDNIQLYAYTSTASASPHNIDVKKLSVNPITATASQIWDAIGNTSSSYYFFIAWTAMWNTGWHNIYLNDYAKNDFKNSISSGVWKIGFIETNEDNTRGIFKGYTGSSLKPYCKVTYHIPTFIICGRVYSESVCNNPIEGVKVNFSNNGGYTYTSSNGYYEKALPQGWSGTATPTYSGISFSPSQRSYSNLNSTQVDQNYYSSNSCTVSGYIKKPNGQPLSGIAVKFYSGTGSCISFQTTTNSSGYYSVSIKAGWTGYSKAVQSGYTFTPTSRSYTRITSNKSNQDFTRNSNKSSNFSIESPQDSLSIIQEDILIYPNPAHSKIYIDNKQENILNVNVFNISGKCLLKESSFDGFKLINLDISFLQNGLYIFEVHTLKNIIRKKVYIYN
jgi:hypothetical protein